MTYRGDSGNRIFVLYWRCSLIRVSVIRGSTVVYKSVPVTTAWRVLRLRMEERPPDMEGSCEYTEQVVMDSRQEGGPPVWGLGEVLTTLHRKTYDVPKCSQGLELGQILD
jgi:hypothetical protein